MDIGGIEPRVAAGRSPCTGQNFAQCRLTRRGWTDNPEYLAGAHIEADVRQGRAPAAGGSEGELVASQRALWRREGRSLYLWRLVGEQRPLTAPGITRANQLFPGAD